MNYEQKYQKDLEAAKGWLAIAKENNNTIAIQILEKFFPELRESEDEKIWKVVKEYINQHYPVDSPVMYKSKILNWLENQKPIKLNEEDERIREEIYRYFRDLQLSSDREFSPSISIDEILAWLEKQGEQKPIDMIEPKFKPGDKIVEKDIYECGSGTIKEIRDGKYIFEDNCFIYIKEQDLWQLVKEPVEPKFKVGDWVVNKLGHVWHIDSFDKKNYQVSNGDKYNYFPISKQNEMHLWTIQDAEDGDMLAEHETIVLFKKIEGQNIRCYCTYHYLGFNPTFYVGTLQNKNPYCPATKEQRDLLLQKLKETGYEWDAEKKELRTIEHKSLSTEETELNSLAFLTELGYTCIPPTKEKHAEWSEDDKRMIDTIIYDLERHGGKEDSCYSVEINWLKSLKDRVQPQPKQEWSEKDEKIINDAIWLIEHHATDGHKKLLREQTIDKLKSLKPNHWKPSDLQLEALESAYKQLPSIQHFLQSLYNDIKKL